MNTPFKLTKKYLTAQILLAIAALVNQHNALAACTDNGAGTLICDGSSDVTSSMSDNQFVLDNTSAEAILNITTIDNTLLSTPAVVDADGYELIPAEYGVVVRNTSNNVSPTSMISANGANPVVVNVLGAKVDMRGIDPLTYTFLRVFDPAGWSNDLNGLLYNGGQLAGYASVIATGANTSSLTVNNNQLKNGIYNPANFTYGSNSIISASGDYSAAILSNSPLVTLNNTGAVDNVVTYAGATYTPPVGGSSDANVITTGRTVINNGTDDSPASIRDIYVVDRNPLLTAAQNDNPALVLAYSTSDVGPRDSVINNNGVKYAFSGSYLNNVYLGSGIHTVNNSYSYIGNIYVDQRSADVVDVTNGIATNLYQVNGGREFTLNHSQANTANRINSVTINDVLGANNTINMFGSGEFNTNLLTNGLGNNIVNYTCDLQQICTPTGSVVGFKEMSFAGSSFTVSQSLAVAGDIHINANHLYLIDFSANGLPPTTLTANNVIVGAAGKLEADRGDANNPHTLLLGDQTMGQIDGNLINRGVVNIGNATLNVSGNASMEQGSKFLVAIGPGGPGQLNAAATTFDSNSTLIPIVKLNVRVLDGDSFIAATNATGTPMIQNGGGFLQWIMSQDTGDLVLTADVGVPTFLKSQLTPAANNAVAAFFSYTGDDYLTSKLQTELLGLRSDNVISAAERLHPEINDGAIRMVLGNTDKLFGVLDTRLLATHINASKREPSVIADSTDDKLLSSKSIWVQGFGDRGTQESLQGADGYGMSSAGMAAGVDREIGTDGNTRVGFAFGYARGNITNSGNTVNNRIDTNSYMAAIYGSHNLSEWYINGAVGIGRNTYDTRRQLIDHSGVGQHDSWQLSTRVDAGWPILMNDNFSFIPVVSLDYTHLKESGYKENGTVNRRLTEPCPGNPAYTCPVIVAGVEAYELSNSPINLEVGKRSFDSLRSGLGARAVYSLQEKNWGAELELHGMYRHEFGDLAQDSKASFVSGSNSFISPGIKPIRDDFVIGASLRLTGDDENDQLTLLTSYDANIREKYFGQIMTLNLRYDFDQAPRYLKTANAKLAAAKAKQVPTQFVSASEKDIAEIQAAIQSGSADDEISAVDAEKHAAIDKTIQTWAAALSNKSLDVYFNSYAANFVTPDGSTRQQWERKRKTEISKDDNTAIKISYLTIKPNGDHAIAVFTQTLAAGAGQESLQKVVDLENRNGRWLIVREDSMEITQ